MSNKTGNIHVWAPDFISAKGGIQSFSHHLVEALCTIVSSAEIRVLVKNDLPEAMQQTNGFYQINVCGHWPLQFRTGRFAAECLRYAWRDNPRVIIATHLHFGPLAQAIKQSMKLPYVLVAHGIEAWQVNSPARRRALRQADLVLAVSRYTRDRLIQEGGLDSERVRVLPNTFTPGRFNSGPKPARLLQRYGLTPQNSIILTIGRLSAVEQYKGYDQIIRAMPQILRAVPDARYLLVGAGPDRNRIEKLIAEVGVQSAVILAGFVPDEELSEHYQLCEVFAMPSKGEGFGIVYLEALACGKPVLAGNRDGSRDALADGELGVLVDPDDTSQIAEEIIRILRHQHTHQLIFRPELLTQKVTELFGFETFKRTVADRLSCFFSA